MPVINFRPVMWYDARMTAPHTQKHIKHSKAFRVFINRTGRNLVVIVILISASLAAGAFGYRVTEEMSWIDAFYNAALILSGMGPATMLQHDAAKIFASLYALYSGLLVIAVTGILLAPLFHHVLHRFHRESE